jgi:hypothetical protein
MARCVCEKMAALVEDMTEGKKIFRPRFWWGRDYQLTSYTNCKGKKGLLGYLYRRHMHGYTWVCPEHGRRDMPVY